MGINHCKHYNGRDIFLGETKTCNAGVNPILSFCDNERDGWAGKVPCFKHNVDAPHCPAQVFPTEEEDAAAKQAMKDHMDQFIKNLIIVRPLIEAAHKETGENHGQVDCPECDKQIHWSRAPSNGHVHARCETVGCIAWIE